MESNLYDVEADKDYNIIVDEDVYNKVMQNQD